MAALTEEERAQEAKQKEKEKKEKAAKRKKEKADKLAAIVSKLPKGRAGQGRVRAPSMASLRAYEDRI